MKAIEQYFAVVMFIVLYRVALTFEPVDEILSVDIQMKAIEQCFLAMLFIRLYRVALTFEPDETLKCDHSNESYRAVLSYGAVSFSVFVSEHLRTLSLIKDKKITRHHQQLTEHTHLDQRLFSLEIFPFYLPTVFLPSGLSDLACDCHL